MSPNYNRSHAQQLTTRTVGYPGESTLKLTIALAVVFTMLVSSASAAQVDARLSSREAYVGMPISLRITVSDAVDYQQPKLPDIDGCDVRSAGTPSQSSQITIINGRRNESRSITMQYLITPRREGTFQIPAFTVEVDGKPKTVPAQSFVATKSVTGDLLFVEIEGGKNKVFVGQPLELTLKIWIKPYRDAERNLTLSEADMWNMLSEQTSWGGFGRRIKDMAMNNQRPIGREVLRDDGQGNQRSYYLYEVTATVYPNRPGKIDSNDVHVVVDYPTVIGQSRSPFGSLFEGGAFGANSPFFDLMEDDFFKSSFSNRLTVSSTRPIVGEVSVNATEVVPVPTAGRPEDYRGAVGQYQIVTQATPTTVDAGDPITLNIGIVGTGPMELVQAPHLVQLKSLTADFKVPDESLAGFVQDDSKLFVTTIRPRREGINQIPSIPFSFFDPNTETYQTVESDPISITVNKSETLALDSIVDSASIKRDAHHSAETITTTWSPDFTNDHSLEVLVSHSPASANAWWWVLVIAPPVVWLATWLAQRAKVFAGLFTKLRSARSRCLHAIERAEDRESVAQALAQYIARRSGKPCPTFFLAMGVLRVAGIGSLANEVEAFLLDDAGDSAGSGAPTIDAGSSARERHELSDPEKAKAVALLERLESAFDSQSKSRVKLSGKRVATPALNRIAKRALGLLLGALLAASAMSSVAAEPLKLSVEQEAAILKEAGVAYTRAMEAEKNDSADAKELFQTAADKYQLLVDSGVRNGRLYGNLANAYLRSGELGYAIVNYERALKYEPNNRQWSANLQFAESRVVGQVAAGARNEANSLESYLRKLRIFNTGMLRFVGSSTAIWTLAISSLLFWGLLIARTRGFKIPGGRFLAIPALLLIFSFGSAVLTATTPPSPFNAIIVANNVSLRAGDGEQFDQVRSIDAAQGHRVEILAQRGSWARIRNAEGHTGWVRAQVVESLDLNG